MALEYNKRNTDSIKFQQIFTTSPQHKKGYKILFSLQATKNKGNKMKRIMHYRKTIVNFASPGGNPKKRNNFLKKD